MGDYAKLQQTSGFDLNVASHFFLTLDKSWPRGTSAPMLATLHGGSAKKPTARLAAGATALLRSLADSRFRYLVGAKGSSFKVVATCEAAAPTSAPTKQPTRSTALLSMPRCPATTWDDKYKRESRLLMI